MIKPYHEEINMKKFSDIINSENFFNQSENFKKNKPFKFAFIEDFVSQEFYNKLYNSYPSFDKSWEDGSTMNKNQLVKNWGGNKKINVDGEKDPNFSQEWNEFKLFCESDEFISYIRKFSGVPVNKLKSFQFLYYRKGGFQMTHIHNAGPSTLILMFYLTKGWQKGDPGGTYISTDADDIPSKDNIIFEPYNLDNSLVIFHDGPNAAHGVRQITKDVTRLGVQIYLEEYTEAGWSGFTSQSDDEKNKRKTL